MIIPVPPSPSTSCHLEVRVFYLHAGGFHFPCLQLLLPLCGAGLRWSVPLAPAPRQAPSLAEAPHSG